MINFSPQITVEIGSVTSICCSIFCMVVFYYWYRQSKKDRIEMTQRQVKVEDLSEAFCKLTDVLMGDKEDENDKKTNGPILTGIDPCPHGTLDQLRDSRAQDTIQDDNKGKVIEREKCPQCLPTCKPRIEFREECREYYDCGSKQIDCSENMQYCKECCEKKTSCKKVRYETSC